MQAVARLRLLKDLVEANILPVVALQSVAHALGARGVNRSNSRWQSLRPKSRYVASCPAVDQPAWLHTTQDHAALMQRPSTPYPSGESFAKYLQMPASKPTHLTFMAKKCKELAVASINSSPSMSVANNFFSSIQILLQQDQDLQQSAFYCACASAAVQVAETAQAKGIWCWDQASHLVRGLCDQIQPHRAHLSAFSAVNLLQALVKCHLQHGSIPQDCLNFATGMVSEASHQLTQQGVSLAAWACAHLFQRHNPTKFHPLLDKLAARTLWFKQSDATKLQHISTIIWSMARSQYLPSEEVLLNLTKAACIQIHDALPHAAQDIEMMFLGYAWLGYPPPPQARQTFVQHFLHQRLRGYQASNMAWSLAVLGMLDMPTFCSLLSHITQRDLGDIKMSRQLHHAAEFLRPKAAAKAASDEWHQLMGQLHLSWPEQPASRKRTRRIHADVLAILHEGLGLKCRQDVPIAREHDQSLFSMDILIERQPGIPFDIAVEVDGPDAFIHNRPIGDRHLGPTMFRNSMLLRYVPCLLTVPYSMVQGRNLHETTLYLQDRLRSEVQRFVALSK